VPPDHQHGDNVELAILQKELAAARLLLGCRIVGEDEVLAYARRADALLHGVLPGVVPPDGRGGRV
jgi:hypothetical protein